MDSTGLTLQEEDYLKKRGFFIKELMQFSHVLLNIPLQFFEAFLGGLIGGVGASFLYLLYDLDIRIIILGIFLGIIPTIIKTLKSLRGYIFLNKIFYSRSLILFAQSLSVIKTVDIHSEYIGSYHFDTYFPKKSEDQNHLFSIKDTSREVPKLFIFLFLVPGFLFLFYEIHFLFLMATGFSLFQWIYLPFILIWLGLYTLSYFLNLTIQFIQPLYAFGNLGEKIQKLTPEIEKKSKIIQENLKSDMNFKILSEGFDSLSSTFSQIISLVIKLENVERRANKGNLFDSEKYINSLRSDILEPLKSLKSFLEKQKEELLLSQKELERIRVGGSQDSGTSPEGQRVRVRVGGRDPETPQGYFQDSLRESRGVNSGGQESSGGQQQAMLASKRSEPIIAELTENIKKLDEMIGKLG